MPRKTKYAYTTSISHLPSTQLTPIYPALFLQKQSYLPPQTARIKTRNHRSPLLIIRPREKSMQRVIFLSNTRFLASLTGIKKRVYITPDIPSRSPHRPRRKLILRISYEGEAVEETFQWCRHTPGARGTLGGVRWVCRGGGCGHRGCRRIVGWLWLLVVNYFWRRCG